MFSLKSSHTHQPLPEIQLLQKIILDLDFFSSSNLTTNNKVGVSWFFFNIYKKKLLALNIFNKKMNCLLINNKDPAKY